MKSPALRHAAILAALYAATVCGNVIFRRELVPRTDVDLVQRVFGNARSLIASWAYMKAEEYHHNGLPFLKAMAYHEGESSLLDHLPGHGDEAGHTHDHAHDHAGASAKDLYARLYAEVKVTQDTHLSMAQGREMLPWFYIEVAFDPHDIRGYVLGAFILQQVGRADEALAFLKEGEENNPRSAEVMTSLGQAYYARNSFDEAFGYFARACELWREGKGPNAVMSRYQQTDRFLAFDYLGSLYEKRGDYAAALAVYKELYRLDPAPILLAKMRRVEELTGR